jgi:cob(I)alamin adenosyltransferase
MVHLTRIYTKTGDDGTTSLGDMSRTSKNDPRLEAYATVDEANSSIGVALALGEISDDVRALLVRIQNDLFDVGADLCTSSFGCTSLRTAARFGISSHIFRRTDR